MFLSLQIFRYCSKWDSTFAQIKRWLHPIIESHHVKCVYLVRPSDSVVLSQKNKAWYEFQATGKTTNVFKVRVFFWLLLNKFWICVLCLRFNQIYHSSFVIGYISSTPQFRCCVITFAANYIKDFFFGEACVPINKFANGFWCVLCHELSKRKHRKSNVDTLYNQL